MQRRATALWAALFVVLAVGAYAMIGAAQEPALVEDPDHSLSNGDSVSFDGAEYTYVNDSGTHTLVTFNESARDSATFENGSQMDYRNATYDVVIPNASDPSSFALHENQTLPENVTTTTLNETEYVVVEDDGNRTLVETDQYVRDRFGEPRTESFSEGGQIEYGGNTSDVANVTQDEVRLAWDAPQNESTTLAEGDEVSLGGTEYVVHVSADSLQLSSDVEGYERQVEVRDTYNERVNGLWAVAIICGLSAITLIGLAYMPSRY